MFVALEADHSVAGEFDITIHMYFPVRQGVISIA